jgi:superfamily I DNA and/or RNA helicase
MKTDFLNHMAAEIELAKDAKPLKLFGLKRGTAGIYVCLTQLKLKGEGVLVIGSESFSVSIQSSNGLTGFSGMEECQEEFVREAYFFQDTSALMQKVLDEYTAHESSELEKALFDPNVVAESVDGAVVEGLNPSQSAVLNHAVAKPITIVGAAAGTGKTKTIVATAKILLSNGERVLVCSHANLAVEGVFASYLNGDHIENMVVGISTDLPALQKYSPKAIVEAKGQEIKDEIEVLDGAIIKIAEHKRELNAVIEPVNASLEANHAILGDLERKAKSLKGEMGALLKTKADLEKRLHNLENGFLSSISSFISNDKKDSLKSEISSLVVAIASKAQELDGATERAKLVKSANATKEQEAIKAKKELVNLVRDEGRIKDRMKFLKQELEKIVFQDFYSDAKLAGVTLLSAATNHKIRKAGFDTIIIDEASMANVPMLLLTLKCASKRVIIFGDPMQLSPVAKIKELKTSIYDLLGITQAFSEGKVHPKAMMLDTQFRCHPDIAHLTSSLFYGGLLKNGREHTGKKAMYIRNSHGTGNGYRVENGSYVNIKHQLIVMDQVRSALKRGQRSIGVISPFKAQAQAIQTMFEIELAEQYPDADFKASTIHAFQGQEKDVVIFDFTFGQSHREYGLPQMLLGDMHSEAAKLLNVATTRARNFFVLVADLQHTHKMTSQIINSEDQAVVKWLKGIEELAFAV